jgi:hypothetical protein
MVHLCPKNKAILNFFDAIIIYVVSLIVIKIVLPHECHYLKLFFSHETSHFHYEITEIQHSDLQIDRIQKKQPMGVFSSAKRCKKSTVARFGFIW